MLSNAETALLGLLSEKDKHAYQVEKDIQERSMREWTDLSMSSVYKLLTKLEKEGAVGSRREISNENRTRKIYSLTEVGLQRLKETLLAIVSEPEIVKSRMDVAISNMAQLSLEEAIQGLTRYRGQLLERIEGYEGLEAYLKGENCPNYRLAFAYRPIHLLRGEVEWVDHYIKDLKRGGELG